LAAQLGRGSGLTDDIRPYDLTSFHLEQPCPPL
jgi:hypothetical protein